MTAQPAAPGPDTGSYEVIHLGDQAAVVVPVSDFLRLRALEQAASPQDLEDAEDAVGSPDVRRLRVGRYRILYETSDDAVAIRHIARGVAGS